MAKENIRNRKSQVGAAMLIMVAILTLGMVSLVLAALRSSPRNETTDVRNRNAVVLAQAKEALIGYVVKQAASYAENAPGELPCPESPADAGTVNEGRANINFCNPTDATNKSVGRLPWRTLGIDKLVDANSEPLWYAVSQNWVAPALGVLPTVNPGTAGQLSADGVTGVVAVIIAPGSRLNVNPTGAQAAQGCVARNQTRTDRSHVVGGGDPDYRDYLECENASAPIDATFGTTIINNAANPVINDQMVTITASEILNALQGPLSERMQRTVAPLLSEFSDKWVGGGKFLPYAVPFATAQPDLATPLASNGFCGTAGTTEGMLPIATNTAPCATSWNATMTPNDSLTLDGCTAASATAPVSCTFRYYTFTPFGNFLFGITGASSVSADFTASAPGAASTFRFPIAASDVTVTSGPVTISGFNLSAPKTDGTVALSFTATVNSPNLCRVDLVGGIACVVLSGLFATPTAATVQFPQLPTPTLQGIKLPAAALAASSAPPFNFLNPAATEPHYWFMQNQWYRYTYYAVSGNASAAAAGGNLTINGFPAANGNTNDKRFVLALMGPAVSGQTRNAAAALANYVEGANAATTASPRVFAYQVYANPGNDRIATCPFVLGAGNLCD